MRSLVLGAVLPLALALATPAKVTAKDVEARAAACTVTAYASIASAVSSYSNIVLSGISAPAIASIEVKGAYNIS